VAGLPGYLSRGRLGGLGREFRRRGGRRRGYGGREGGEDAMERGRGGPWYVLRAGLFEGPLASEVWGGGGEAGQDIFPAECCEWGDGTG